MPEPIGVIAALFRYPVKSMAAEPLAAAELGFHGLRGDRRLAFHRLDVDHGRPWLSASRMPDLVRYAPVFRDAASELPTHVRTPAGAELPIFGKELAAEVRQNSGVEVQMMQLSHGMFDDANLSLISTSTIAEIARLAGLPLDPRRFRPNLLLHLTNPAPFQEDRWLGALLTLGDGPTAPQIALTQHDIRCSMVNLDPDTAAPSPAVQKAIVGANHNRAGAYAAIL
ncbi:MAG TPA: MOSC N-terminal beta barrel domain-containing protein, partial [Terriglobales bacterium]|nr:MOSC N-terminal beta barrel domain-containing protein [Terriglobales bacterium]